MAKGGSARRSAAHDAAACGGLTRLEAGQVQAALASGEEALALESQKARALRLKAEILDRRWQAEQAMQLRAQVKQMRKTAWPGQVEAEIRGQHEMMGEAIRHETL